MKGAGRRASAVEAKSATEQRFVRIQGFLKEVTKRKDREAVKSIVDEMTEFGYRHSCASNFPLRE